MQVAGTSVLEQREHAKATMSRGAIEQGCRDASRAALGRTTPIYSTGNYGVDVGGYIIRNALLLSMEVASAGGVGGGAETAAHGGELQTADNIAKARGSLCASYPRVLHRWGERGGHNRAVRAAQEGARLPPGREGIGVDMGDAQGLDSGNNRDASKGRGGGGGGRGADQESLGLGDVNALARGVGKGGEGGEHGLHCGVRQVLQENLAIISMVKGDVADATDGDAQGGGRAQ
jgi:hypothetical protein